MKKLTVKETLEIVKNKNESRYKHIYGTYEMATYLASKYNEDLYKCQIAAILHDYAKNENLIYMEEIIKSKLDKKLFKFSKQVYHGFVGAYLVEKKFNIHDEDILNAIRYHVTGHPNMNNIGKIVFIADYIEKNRKHDTVEFCRYLSDISLNIAVLGCAEGTLDYLKRIESNDIHPLTLKTYNKFMEMVGANNYGIIKNNYKSL